VIRNVNQVNDVIIYDRSIRENLKDAVMGESDSLQLIRFIADSSLYSAFIFNVVCGLAFLVLSFQLPSCPLLHYPLLVDDIKYISNQIHI